MPEQNEPGAPYVYFAFISCCEIFIIIIFLMIAIPCWITGAVLPYYYTLPVFISIPLFQDPSNDYGYIFGAIQSELQNFSDKYQFSIAAGTLFNQLKQKIDLYLIHNLWGYDFNLKISNPSGKIFIDKNFSENMNLTSPTNVNAANELTYLHDYPSALIKNQAKIFQPYYTKISSIIDLDCSKYDVCYTDYNPKLRKISLMRYDFGSDSANISFTFTGFKGYPFKFTDIPQAYIVGYTKTASEALLIAGPVFFVILILEIIACVIAFAFASTGTI